jgi:hypothetical protein
MQQSQWKFISEVAGLALSGLTGGLAINLINVELLLYRKPLGPLQNES